MDSSNTPIEQLHQDKVPSQTYYPPPIQPNFIKLLAIIFFIGVLLSGGIYLVVKNKEKNSQKTTTQVVTSLTSTPIPPSPTLDPTADWKLYSDKDCNYSIKYPTNWNLIYSDAQLHLGPISSEPSKSAGYPLEVYMFCDSLESLQTEKETNAMLLPSISPTVRQAEDLSIVEYFLPYGSNGGFLTIVKSLKKGLHVQLMDPSLKATYDQIISTIKFVDNNSTPNHSPIINISKEEAIDKVKNLKEVRDFLSQTSTGTVDLFRDDITGDNWIVHVYEIKSTGPDSFNFYYVDKENGKIINFQEMRNSTNITPTNAFNNFPTVTPNK